MKVLGYDYKKQQRVSEKIQNFTDFIKDLLLKKGLRHNRCCMPREVGLLIKVKIYHAIL